MLSWSNWLHMLMGRNIVIIRLIHNVVGSLLFIAIIVSVSAESVNISGVVVNKEGKPISGAIVKLSSRNLIDTTTIDGRYSLNNTQIIMNFASFPQNSDRINLNKGSILLSLKKTAQIKIELFNINGKLLEKVIDNSVTTGNFRFDFINRQFVSSIIIIRVSIGQYTSTFRYLPLLRDKGSVVSSFNTSIASLSTIDRYGLAETSSRP